MSVTEISVNVTTSRKLSSDEEAQVQSQLCSLARDALETMFPGAAQSFEIR